MKLKEFGGNNQESQLLEVRKEQAVQICTMYGIPPHKIGILDRATNNNIEQQGDRLRHRPGLGAGEGRRERGRTLPASPRDEREDATTSSTTSTADARRHRLSRYRAYAIGRQWGWLSSTTIREFENKNPLPDGAGKNTCSR
jgi:phage portal protein BeeE